MRESHRGLAAGGRGRYTRRLMDEKELKKLETRFQKKTGKDPTVTIPPGGATADIPEFVKRGGPLKARLNAAKTRGDLKTVAHLQGQIELLKRVLRARAIQRELNKIEGKPDGYLTPWPDGPAA
jgi:hypothetical protein